MQKITIVAISMLLVACSTSTQVNKIEYKNADQLDQQVDRNPASNEAPVHSGTRWWRMMNTI